MREITFRGKKLNGIEWVYGDLLTKDPHYGFCIVEDGCIKHNVIPESIGQFTGLHDRNGIGIYEGDVYRTSIGDKYQVISKNGAFCGGKGHDACAPLGWVSEEGENDLFEDNFYEKIEVIGDIYKNENILK